MLWLLEELEIPYRIERYTRDPKTMLAPSTLKEVHPLGKSPVLTDGECTVAESGAILEYVLERYGGGRLAPQVGTDEHLRFRYFMHYAEGSLMPPLLVALLCNRVRSAKLPFFVRPVAAKIADGVGSQFVAPNLHQHLVFLEDQLGASEFFAGSELSAADIQMSYPVEALVERGGEYGPTVNLRAYLKRLRARPAYARALDKGGPILPE